MLKKPFVLLAIGLVILAIAGGVYLFRPITIHDTDQVYASGWQFRTPLFTVSQALQSAGFALDPADRVAPTLDETLPLDGQITITRAIHLYVWDNGALRTASTTTERLPRRLLATAAVLLNEGDRVTMNGRDLSLDQPIEPGQYFLQVHRARPFTLVDAGQERSISTQAVTVAQALWQMDTFLAPGDQISRPAGAVLPEQATAITVQRARPVTIAVQGQQLSGHSAAATVGLALLEAGVALQDLDYSLPAENEPVPADGQIRVVRVGEELLLEQTLIPFERATQPDPNTELDQRSVIEAGQYGVNVSRYRVRYEDGQEVSRALDSDWVASEPKNRIVGIGTKIVPYTLDTPDGTIEYWRAVSVYATGYSPCRLGRPNYCNSRTASGANLTKGIVAVTVPWYRLMAGQRVYIPGYGFATIADTGYGIPGTPWIDLGYDDDNYVGGGRQVTMYFLTPAPESVPLVLP